MPALEENREMHHSKKSWLSARVEPQIAEAAKARAEQDGMKVQTLIEHAVRLWLQQPADRTRLRFPER